MDNRQTVASKRVYEFAEAHGVDGNWAVDKFIARGATDKAERVVKFRCSFGRYVADTTPPGSAGRTRTRWLRPARHGTRFVLRMLPPMEKQGRLNVV